jgi:small subunit ribosomal protein S18
MEPLPARRPPLKGKGAKGKGKFSKGPRKEGAEGGFKKDAKYTPRLLGKAYFQRRRGCPFSGPKAAKIDYKDVRMLGKYLSDLGKILPRHLSGVCAAKQRELATAIARARMLALLPFVVKADPAAEREQRNERIAARAARFAERDAQRGPRTAPAAEAAE